MAEHKPHAGGGYLPTPEQELVLRAALGGGEEAVDAWREWTASSDLDRVDHPTARLLPLVYCNLRSTPDATDLGRLKGLYRQAWYKNQLLLRVVAQRLRAFHEAGIETLVLKGMALIPCCYKDVGSRPMGDFDVLVHAGQASSAMAVLREAGWRPQDLPEPERAISARHAQSFVGADEGACDLHWRLLQECCDAGADDDDFWDAASPLEVGGVRTLALCPADQLLHVCVHGIKWHGIVSPVRWVADAVKVTDAAGNDMDWSRLLAMARKYRLTLPMRDALIYLRDRWGVAVPPALMHDLEEAPVSYMERSEHAARTRPPTLPRLAMTHWARNVRLAGDVGMVRQLAHFPDYYRRFYGLEHAYQAPLRAARVVGKRAKKTLRADGSKC